MEVGSTIGNGRLLEIPKLIGVSAPMQAIKRHIEKVALADVPVVVSGESGTGKEVVARAIHDASPRQHLPFVAVNCGAIPASLIQSELFGYEKGAFTGAQQRHVGRLEAADGGTVLLDEIADLSQDLQVNLLRFLQEKSIERLGGVKTVPVDVRVIAATHLNLEEAVVNGSFREDLYYRLNVLRIDVPPLRNRGSDIELIAQYYLEHDAADNPQAPHRFDTAALDAMRMYDWPGNVRELINRVRRAVVMSDGPVITSSDLGLDALNIGKKRAHSLADLREIAERRAIEDALQRSGDNVSKAARELQVSRMTLYRYIQKHGINLRIHE